MPMQRNKRFGKFRITQWSFWVDGEGSVKVPVYLVTDRDKTEPFYEAVILHDPTRNRTRNNRGKTIVTGANLAVLESEVENSLVGLAEIVWEPWIRIAADRGSSFGEDWEGEKVGFLATEIQLGTTTDGKKCWRGSDVDSVHEGAPDRCAYGDDDFRWVYIRDTSENREILAAFAAGFVTVASKLDKFLQQDDVLKRLAGMAGKLLPMSKPPPKKKKKRRRVIKR